MSFRCLFPRSIKKGSKPTQANDKVIQTFPQPSTVKGRNFTIYTDHKPLVHAMAKITELWSARQQRHLSAIPEFSTDKAHVSGKSNIVADCLSRSRTNNAVSLGIDYIAMARAQAASIDVPACKTAFTCLEITNTRLNELVCDVSTDRPRPLLISDAQCATLFTISHIQQSKSPQTSLRQIWSARNAETGQ